MCPDGSTRGPLDVSDPVHPSELDQSKVSVYCGVRFLTPTATLASPTATETSSVAATASTPQTPTITFTPAPIVPLLTGNMTGCGSLGTSWWVNLRLADPHPEIIGKNLQVTIGEAPATCGINQGNLSLLTCYGAKGITYPASVVVKLDGVEVNNFTINPNQSICTLATATNSNPGSAPTSTAAPGGPPAGTL